MLNDFPRENGPSEEPTAPPPQGHGHEWINPTLVPPADDDHSDAAELRRDILDIARELGIDLSPNAPPAAVPPAAALPSVPSLPLLPAGGAALRRLERPPDGRAAFDLRASIPFLLMRVARLLARRSGQGGEPRASRDLVLAEVGRAGSGRPRRIGRTLALRAATLSGILRRAERDGLVQRRPHAADRRLRLVVLTEEGADEAERAVRAWRGLDEAVATALGERDRAELRRLLRRLARALARGAVVG